MMKDCFLKENNRREFIIFVERFFVCLLGLREEFGVVRLLVR